ncbi:hypothetical protein [Myxococcus xanthus]|nr:hypothetical protein [Myxococcus xanthus]
MILKAHRRARCGQRSSGTDDRLGAAVEVDDSPGHVVYVLVPMETAK